MKEPLNFDESMLLFNQLQIDIEKKHNKLYEFALQNKNLDLVIPRALRLFKIRLNLAIGLKIDFNDQYAQTKDKKTKDTYIQIYKCNEAWFSYESMEIACENLHLLKNVSTNNKIEYLYNVKCGISKFKKIHTSCNTLIKQGIYDKIKVYQDIKKYIAFLESNPFIKPAISSKLAEASIKINTKKYLRHKEILAIAYASRNIFLHGGETAKTGVGV